MLIHDEEEQAVSMLGLPERARPWRPTDAVPAGVGA
jgi:hypothetical protein